jgi:hypothetical protein
MTLRLAAAHGSKSGPERSTSAVQRVRPVLGALPTLPNLAWGDVVCAAPQIPIFR